MAKTFIKITNKNIYDKLIEIENHVKETNGKVKLNSWLSKTAITIALTCLAGMVTLFIKI